MKKLLPVILGSILFLVNSIHSLAQSHGSTDQENLEVTTNANTSAALSYQANLGQIIDTDGNPRPDIKYVVKGKGMTVYFRETGISYVFEQMNTQDVQPSENTDWPVDIERLAKSTMKMHRVDIDFVGANPDAILVAEEKQDYYTNYYLAHCPEGITGVPEYGKVTYQDLYPGIDWILYLDEGQLRYDLYVEGGADPSKIEMALTGSNDFEITEEGALEITTPLGIITEEAPVVYQGKERIPGR